MDPLLTGDKHPAVEPDGDVGFVFELIGEGGGDFGVLVEVAEKDVLGYCWELWAVLCHRGPQLDLRRDHRRVETPLIL